MLSLNEILNILCIVIISYIVGSIPTSIIVSRITKGIDIRNYGSGNAGGTNSFRVMGWKIGVVVASIDIFKGFVAAEWISKLNIFGTPSDPYMVIPVLAGAAAVFGHCYTIFAGFKGGKGIATSAGMIIALSPIALLTVVLVFALVLTTSGYVSLSSLSAAIAFPLTMFMLNLIKPGYAGPVLLIFSIFAASFVFYTHRSNIKRLLSGTENRFNKVRIFARK